MARPLDEVNQKVYKADCMECLVPEWDELRCLISVPFRDLGMSDCMNSLVQVLSFQREFLYHFREKVLSGLWGTSLTNGHVFATDLEVLVL